MTREQAIETARRLAKSNGWDWHEPVRADRFRQWLIGPVYWKVVSNTARRGGNVIVTLADATGRVSSANFAPR